jgi:soluble lytic murein transglycosylase-like protein
VVRNWAILTSLLLVSQIISTPAMARKKKEAPPLPECPVDTVIRTADPRLLDRYSALAGCRPQVLLAPADPSEYTEAQDARIAAAESDPNTGRAAYAIDRQDADRERFQNQYAGLPTVAVTEKPDGNIPFGQAKPENGIAVERWTYSKRSDRNSLSGTGTVFRIAPEFPDVPASLVNGYTNAATSGFAVSALPTAGDSNAPDQNANLSQNAAAILAMRPKSYRTQFDQLIADTANRHRIDPLLLHAVIQQESGYKAFVVSHAGARGLMQIMPATGRSLGVSTPNLTSASHNVDAGARLLRKLYFTYNGNFELVLAAYNAGEGAVAKYGNRIPPYRETQNYVKSVMARYYKLVAEQGKDGTTN